MTLLQDNALRLSCQQKCEILSGCNKVVKTNGPDRIFDCAQWLWCQRYKLSQGHNKSLDHWQLHASCEVHQETNICYVCTVFLTFAMLPSVKLMPYLDHRHQAFKV